MRLAAASAAVAVVLLDVTAVGVLLRDPRRPRYLALGRAVGDERVLAALLAAGLPPRGPGAHRAATADGVGRAGGGDGPPSAPTADSTSTLVAGRAVEGGGAGPAAGLPGGRLPRGAARARRRAALPLAAFAFGRLVGGELRRARLVAPLLLGRRAAAAILAAPALRDGGRTEARTRGRRPDAALAAGLVASTDPVVQMQPWGSAPPRVVDRARGGAPAHRRGRRPRARRRAAAGGAGGRALASRRRRSSSWPTSSNRCAAESAVGARRRGGGGGALGLAAATRFSLASARGIAGSSGGGARRRLPCVDRREERQRPLGAGLVLAGGGFGLAAGAATTASRRAARRRRGRCRSTLAISGALFQHVQADERASGESFEHALSRGVASGALILVPLAAASGRRSVAR